MKTFLVLTCLFTSAACVWLIAMESVLKHPGYQQRSLVDSLFILQAIATIFVPKSGATIFRYMVLLGAAAMAWWGARAIYADLRKPHFEGFVLVIGCGLILEGLLTLLMLSRTRPFVPRPRNTAQAGA